jgi:hypothetical protein
MTTKNDELDIETLKQLLLMTREKLITAVLTNVELETALKIEREKVAMLTEHKSGK